MISRPRFTARPRGSATFLLAAGLLGSLATTGCGIGSSASPSTEPVLIPAFEGKLFGGPTPVVGATVKIYATGNDTAAGLVTSQAYGTGTLLQEATTASGMSSGQDTDQYGAFSFAGGYFCPAGQFAYVVASGGNTGAGVVNNASVLVAALGRCEDLYNGTGPYTVYKGGTIYVNEITTIAAAYALGNFASTTTSSSGVLTAVGIGADAANNASTGSATQAAGLRHAFANAANLVNVFNNASIGSPNGAYANSPANSAAIVPQAEINALGNSLVSCVNSTGSTSAPCTTLFGATTLAGGNAPTNTFQAMVNLAANPLLTGAGTNATTGVAYSPSDIYNLGTAITGVYTPALSSAPTDWSISIHYPAGIGLVSGTSQGLLNPASGALDMNDNFYVGNQNNTTTATSTSTNLIGFGSNGALLGISADSTSTTSGLGVSADAAGNVYMVGSTANANPLYKFTPSGGAPGAGTLVPYAAVPVNAGVPLDTAVDAHNNVWYSTSSNSATNKSVWEYVAGATNPTFEFSVVSQYTYGIAVDPNQNIWASAYTTPGVAILQNMGTVAAPSYTPVAGTPATANLSFTINTANSGTNIFGLAFGAAPSGSTAPYIAYAISNLTFSGNALQGATPLTPTVSGSAVTALSQGTQIAGTTAAPVANPRYASTDGAGSLWIADTGGSRIRVNLPNLATAAAARANTVLKPCLVAVASGAYTCGSALNAPRYVVPDSTGSLWVTNFSASAGSGSVDQIIGAATPSWPLLSLGLSNTKP